MSSPTPIADSGRFPGQKTNFSHTCNLLSQYVKDKRSISLSSPGTTVADGYVFNNNNNNNNSLGTMNFFPLMAGKPVEENSYRSVGHSVNLFPQSSVFNNSALPHPCLGKRESPEPPSGQMTIFYGGQVMVFNDLSADKAKEVMDLASCFESSFKKRKVESPASPNQNPNLNPYQNRNLQMNQALIATSFGTPVSMVPVTAASPRPLVANASDLPIARKASLHRFLEKRKDRLIGKIPDMSSEAISKPTEGNSWLGLGSLPVYQAQQQF